MRRIAILVSVIAVFAGVGMMHVRSVRTEDSGGTQHVGLFAGQAGDAARVCVAVNDDDLDVTFTTTDCWELPEPLLLLDPDDMPQPRKDEAIPARFSYRPGDIIELYSPPDDGAPETGELAAAEGGDLEPETGEDAAADGEAASQTPEVDPGWSPMPASVGSGETPRAPLVGWSPMPASVAPGEAPRAPREDSPWSPMPASVGPGEAPRAPLSGPGWSPKPVSVGSSGPGPLEL